MGQITVFSGPERRRRWSDEERLQILAEAFSPGACVADVCRRHDISTSLIYTWRGKLREVHAEAASSAVAGSGFAEAVMLAEGAVSHSPAAPAIVVDLGRGKQVSIFAAASPAQVAAALKALR
jgi:transposase